MDLHYIRGLKITNELLEFNFLKAFAHNFRMKYFVCDV